MHLPPRTVFLSQLTAAIIGSITQIGTQDWLFAHIPGICNPETAEWWCPSTQTFHASSILYGLVGPRKLFSPGHGSVYAILLLGFPIGALMPVLTWLAARRWPASGWKYVCWPVVFSCMSLLPPYLPINFIS